MKRSKRFIALFAALALSFSMLTTAGFAAFAEDDVPDSTGSDAGVVDSGQSVDEETDGENPEPSTPVAEDTVVDDAPEATAPQPPASVPAQAGNAAPAEMEIPAAADEEVTEIALIASKPVCGTHVTPPSASDDHFNPDPDVTSSGDGYEVYQAWWVEGDTLDDVNPINTEFDVDGSESYNYLLMVTPEPGYEIADYADITISVGTVLDARPMIAGMFILVEVPATHKAGSPTESDVVKPTCTEAGSHVETVTCSVCGTVISKETVTDPATGHNWGEWTVKKNPTATEEGMLERVCKNNSAHVETKPIPAMGEKGDKSSTPKTGDETSLAIPAGLAVTGMLTLGGYFILRRKLGEVMNCTPVLGAFNKSIPARLLP